MKKMEKDYAELKKKEQEEMVELRVSDTTHHKKQQNTNQINIRATSAKKNFKRYWAGTIFSPFPLFLAIEKRKSPIEETQWASRSGKYGTC